MQPATPSQNGAQSASAQSSTKLASDASRLAWRRVDLHVHTPASCDYQNPGTTIVDILRRADERGLHAIALTDHNSVRGYANLWREIEDLELLEYLQRLNPDEAARLAEFRDLLSRILVLPGFEFTAQFGFHILAVFPEGTTVRMMEHLLLLLGVPEDKFGSGEVGATTDVLRAYEILASHGALVIGAHVNSTHGIAMQGLRFGGQTKIAYTQDPNLHAMEVTDLLPASNRRSTARFFSGTKTEYPRRMHCIQGSDAHRLEQDPNRDTNLGVGDRPTEVLLPEMSFAALKALFASSEFDRTRPFTPPPSDPVKAARLDGNTSAQAFHESAASKRSHAAIVRDIVAFANGDGGHIFIGLSASEKRPVAGVSGADDLVKELAEQATTQIAPAIPVRMEIVSTDGKPVVVVEVPAGTTKPYAVEPGGIYVRRDGESTLASRNEIVHMVTRDLVVPPPVAELAHVVAVEAAALPLPAQERPAGTKPRRADNQAANGSRPPALPRRQTDVPAPAPLALPAATEPSGLEIHEEIVAADPVAPTTGIEVLESFEQDNIRYYTLRDLRYHKLIYNVTKETDRRLWRAAIAQREKGELDETVVRWDGDYGLWRSYRQRTGDRRYDLVYRGDGDPRVFYGVSEAGMGGRWRALVPAVKAPA